MRTPNDLVYGEMKRYPIYINSAVRCIYFCLKLTRMDDYRLPRKAYKMLYDLDRRDKQNWASNIRCKLYQFGFGFVWLNQGVERIKEFVQIFKERLIVCRWQDWDFHINNSERFNFYRTFCTVPDVKPYIYY